MNGCAHADMAGLKAILDDLRLRSETRPAANILVGELDEALVMNGSSYELCEFSRTVFYTGHQVLPDWKQVFDFLFLQRPQANITNLFLFTLVLYIFRQIAAGRRHRSAHSLAE
jgi:hypothetical protein